MYASTIQKTKIKIKREEIGGEYKEMRENDDKYEVKDKIRYDTIFN